MKNESPDAKTWPEHTGRRLRGRLGRPRTAYAPAALIFQWALVGCFAMNRVTPRALDPDDVKCDTQLRRPSSLGTFEANRAAHIFLPRLESVGSSNWYAW